MKEVRMTFGEHLEELRWRIIVSLLYFAGGITISFIYGDTLLQMALRPHEQAIQGAQRNREVKRLEKSVAQLELLQSNAPPEELVSADFKWVSLFPQAVARARIQQLAEGPYASLRQDIEAASFSDADKNVVAAAMTKVGKQVTEVIVGQLTTDLQLSNDASIPQRFARVGSRLENYLAKMSSDTAGKLKEAVGWGADIRPILEKVKGFNDFLERKRDQAAQDSATLDQLREWARDSKQTEGLSGLLVVFEKSIDTLTRPKPKPPIIIDYTEHFTSFLKIAMIFGLFISVPFILYEMWKFVGAGLRENEQRYVVTFMPFSLLLFVCGVLFGYFVMIPVGLEFLASWGDTEVDLQFALGSYIGLFLTLTLILGLVFQTPLLMVFAFKIGVVDVSLYRRARRISIFVGVCLAVVLTPPDPFSWCLMAMPMILLYEVGILICSILGPNKAPEEDGESEETAESPA
ncbi:MAG: twin-arginine translocase subunit TatC [Planctomycetota bacterium]